MGTPAESEGRSGGGARRLASRAWIRLRREERGETPPLTRSPPPLRPSQEEPAPNEGGPLLDLSLIGGRLHHWLLRPRWCPHAFSGGGFRASTSATSFFRQNRFFCVAIIRPFVGRFPLRGGAGSLFTGVRGRWILRTSHL